MLFFLLQAFKCNHVLAKYYSDDQTKKTETDRACSTYEGDVHAGFWWRNLREKYHLKDPGVDRRIILKWIFEKWDGGMDWIVLFQCRVVNAVMNLSFP